jgi:hypothetical protein
MDMINKTTAAILNAKFPGTCLTCKQRFPAGTRVAWVKGVGSVHVANCTIVAQPVAAPVAPVAAPMTFDGKPLADFLNAAKESGKKFPTARFLGPNNVELMLTVAGPKSATPGAVNVFLGGEWTGRITVDGDVHGGKLKGNQAALDCLTVIQADPAHAATTYGRMTCRCSFCNRPLKADGSTEVGYGPDCAKKFNLPYTYRPTPTMTALPVVMHDEGCDVYGPVGVNEAAVL